MERRKERYRLRITSSGRGTCFSLYLHTELQPKHLESQAELSYGRRLRTTVPTLQFNFQPQLIDNNLIRLRDANTKNGYKKYFERHPGACNLSSLRPDDIVFQKLNHERQCSNPSTVLSQIAARCFLLQMAYNPSKTENAPLPWRIQFSEWPQLVDRPCLLPAFKQLDYWSTKYPKGPSQVL